MMRQITRTKGFLVKNNARFEVEGLSITFQNQGSTAVYVDDLLLLPGDGDTWPSVCGHFYKDTIEIKFDIETVIPTMAGARAMHISQGNKLAYWVNHVVKNND